MFKRKDYTLLIIICIILFCILGILYLDKDEEKEEKNIETKYHLLNDYSRFFTVNSCVYKYFSYLSSKDRDSLLKILDKDYIKDNNITSDNILNYVPNLDTNYSFVSKKMYYEKVSDNYYIYYVYGYAQEDINDEIGNKDYYYFKVGFDQKNCTFSIAPIDSNIFEGVSNE